MRTWQNGDNSAQVKEVIDSNFNELETYIHSMKEKRDRGWFKLFGKSKKIEDAEFRIRKQINGVLGSLNDRSEILLRTIKGVQDSVTNEVWKHKHTKDIVESQQRTIETLTNALCDKYQHGLFVYSEDGKIPMVIRNGKKLTDDLTTEFSICWCPGEIPTIQIEQVAATSRDDEE